MAKLLIKNLNSEVKISKDYYFDESDEEIILTGRGEKIGREHLFAHINADKLKVYNLESDGIDIHLAPFTEKNIPEVSLKNVKAERFDIFNGDKKLDISGEGIDDLKIQGKLKRLELNSVKDLEIEYWNSVPEKCELLSLKDCRNFSIRSRRWGGKQMSIENLELSDVKKAILVDCFLVNSKRVLINVEKILLNSQILDEFQRLLKEGQDFFFNAENVGLSQPLQGSIRGILAKLIEVVKTAREKNSIFRIKRVSLGNRWNWEDDETDQADQTRVSRDSVPFEKIEQKDFTLKELLGVANTELRREIVEYLGGLSKLVEKEEEKELIEKNEKGELWCIGDKNNPRDCIKFLRYKDISTDREYLSFVPPETQNILEGLAWKFRVEPTEYQILKAEA